LQLPRHLPLQTWEEIGRQLAAAADSSAWCLGDWLVYGEEAYSGRYKDIIEKTSLEYQTLRNYAWVTRRFAWPRRQEKLSFAHHAEVAALSEPEQNFWLRKAIEHEWSRNRLRGEVRASQRERSSAPSAPSARGGRRDRPPFGEGHHAAERTLHLELAPEQAQLYLRAARARNLGLDEWAVLQLDHAAHSARY
jgi:hypothetical protein